MINKTEHHNISEIIEHLRHFLPAQAPLKDFIHHNTLHAFQNNLFEDALRNANKIFGYKVSLSLEEYRDLYKQKKIKDEVIERVIAERYTNESISKWKNLMLNQAFDTSVYPRIGTLRDNWKKLYRIDMDSLVHPILFRIICSYLDQGVALWNFPVWNKSFLNSIREIEKRSYSSFFRSSLTKKLLLETKCDIYDLLHILLGDEKLYEPYLYDQQFAHQGWSGMVATVEKEPQTLLNPKKISLNDSIAFELLLEIDALNSQFKNNWKPLSESISIIPPNLFAPVEKTELSEVLYLFQLSFEWTYYDEVLYAVQQNKSESISKKTTSFQAMFCIDDRECSLRRYLEIIDSKCQTFGTPGFFGVEFYFKPENGKFVTKLCPAPITPKHLIKEIGSKSKRKKDVHFTKHTHSLFRGWLISQTVGFWSALKLFVSIFKPSMNATAANSFRHMDKVAKLTIENNPTIPAENGLQVGFTIEEMVTRCENYLRANGLIENFAQIIYLIGHGSSSVNNPHYSAYDCGACSGRPGSVNARVMCFMLNHKLVREKLKTLGIIIPHSTEFVGGLHDTTRDEIQFYDEEYLNNDNSIQHLKNEIIFLKALDLNAKERSRRLESIDTNSSAEKIHRKILRRSVSLFEPRPELNHATNAFCIVGGRHLTKGLFLDRRSFLNSYDYKTDLEGKYLVGVMKPLGPVCGGINLEYFFSRVDNQKLGAGTKLPHNVMGLFGVANGIEGDLRPGLPGQMIEVHDPVRLMIIVEHFPEVVLKVIQSVPEMYEWFINNWVHLTVLNPENRKLYYFKNGEFNNFSPAKKEFLHVQNLSEYIETSPDNLNVVTY